MTDLPHFAQPFAFDALGNLVVVEQDSPQEEAAAIYNITVCPIGYRTDQDDFGRPDLEFGNIPIDTGPLERAVTKWEPRADLTLAEHGDAFNAALRTIDVDITAGTAT